MMGFSVVKDEHKLDENKTRRQKRLLRDILLFARRTQTCVQLLLLPNFMRVRAKSSRITGVHVNDLRNRRPNFNNTLHSIFVTHKLSFANI